MTERLLRPTAPLPVAGELVHFNDDDQARQFRNFLRAHRDERHCVALQDYPDPDAIAGAFAYQLLAATVDIDVDILYEGRISHQENLALVHLLDIELTRVTDSLPLDQYDGAVFIDNQGTTTRLTDRLQSAGVPIVAIIDHHAPQGLLEAGYTDIRPIGAAATIFTDYLRSAEVLTLDESSPLHTQLATSLVHALRSETNGFIRAGPEEYAAGAYLSHFADQELLGSILRVQRSRGTMDVIRVALTDRLVIGGYSIAGVGYLRHADRDAIPQATDFLQTEENVHTAIVYGILHGEGDREVVVGSVRTSKVTLDVDQFLKTALGSDARGRYFGGGRSRAGGFEIPVGFLEGTAEPDQLRLKWEAFDQQIRGKLLRAAGLDSADDEDG
ncbi:MAG TPA: bifunctional oligoribonuclease/PAP phosphatase NrnA [Longimicrobiales bacterium]|nr:bifunctional oligoribonuclease/PAP phosphatase NrnA [Longimicrobiales bacterium]